MQRYDRIAGIVLPGKKNKQLVFTELFGVCFQFFCGVPIQFGFILSLSQLQHLVQITGLGRELLILLYACLQVAYSFQDLLGPLVVIPEVFSQGDLLQLLYFLLLFRDVKEKPSSH